MVVRNRPVINEKVYLSFLLIVIVEQLVVMSLQFLCDSTFV